MITATQLSRRRFLALGAGAAGLAAVPAAAAASAAYAIPAGEFGVQPDTEADQSAAFQRAIDAASATGTPVLLPPGRYVVSRLALASGTRLAGVAGATRLVARGGEALATAHGADRIALDGIIFDGGGRDLGAATGLLELQDVDRLDIAACEIVASPGDGLRLTGCGGRIAGNRIADIGHTALHALDGRALDIRDNRIESCGDNGIRVWQSDQRHDGARVTGNRISDIRAVSGGTGQNGNGINIFRAGDVTVSENFITDCAFSAIRNNASDNIMISNNNCRRLGEVAIYSEFGFEGAVVAQNLIDGAALGISVVNLDSGGRLAAVSGNLVRNIEIGGYPEERGIGISVEADTAVTGNVVEDCAFAALNLGFGPYLRDVSATGNVLRNAHHGIAVSVAPGAGATLIADNLLSGMARGAIVGMAWDELVAEDLANGGAARFPHLSVSGNRIA